jgi:hypothetical protein
MKLKHHGHQQGHDDALPALAVTKSDDPMFDNKELIFGKLEPGKSADGVGAARVVRARGVQGRVDRAAARRTRRASAASRATR